MIKELQLRQQEIDDLKKKARKRKDQVKSLQKEILMLKSYKSVVAEPESRRVQSVRHSNLAERDVETETDVRIPFTHKNGRTPENGNGVYSSSKTQ